VGVHVVAIGLVVVYHVRHVLNVQPPGRNIRGDEYPEPAFLRLCMESTVGWSDRRCYFSSKKHKYYDEDRGLIVQHSMKYAF
jgi:hypothetical protein